MDARDLCCRLNCSPLLLTAWIEQGCPVHRNDPTPMAWYDMDEVQQWLQARGITEWPKQDEHDLDDIKRWFLKALERKEITPWEAEKVIFIVGVASWW